MSVRKLSVALDERVIERARASAEHAGTSLSAWLNEAARVRLITEDGLAAVAEYEASHGAFGAVAEKRMDRVLDRLGVGRKRR